MRFRSRVAGRLFIPVFFNAGHGGLHNHVEAQIRAANAARYDVTLMCKPGPWAEHMSPLCRVLTTGYDDIDASTEVALSAGPYDLVHAHPFASRKVGVQVAEKLGVPVLVTHHGPYTDNLEDHPERIDMLVCVSEAARQKIVWKSKIDRARTVVIPNGVDLATFKPSGRPRTRRQVIVPSRFDSDKRYLIEMLVETWNLAADEPDVWADVHWLVVGDGTEMPTLRGAADALASVIGQRRVEFVGWQPPEQLARLLADSSAAVAPGRSALEALACGVPTIALGSRGYVGLIDGAEALKGLHTNFGGDGSKKVDGVMLADVRRALDHAQIDRRRRLAAAITAIHDQRHVDAAHQRLWALISSAWEVSNTEHRELNLR